jgi:hypothetical protein
MTQSTLDNEPPDTPAPGHSGQDPARRIRVSYQRTDGAFSHQAAMQHVSRHYAEVECIGYTRHDEAVATLQAGLDDGWLDFYPSEVNLANNFPTLRDHPGFQDFMAEVRAHLDREREVVLRDS